MSESPSRSRFVTRGTSVDSSTEEHDRRERPARILIVEDEALVALDLVGRLSDLGHEVVAVTDRGDDALRVALERRPEMVIMDIQLKGEIDGCEAALAIREQLDVPVVFLTAFGDRATLQRVEDASPYGYLMKPVTDAELGATIRMALFRHGMEARLRANEERQRQLALEMSSLLEIAEIASSSLDEDEVIDRILPASASLLGMGRATYVCPSTANGAGMFCKCIGPDQGASGRRSCENHHGLRTSRLPSKVAYFTDMSALTACVEGSLPDEMSAAIYIPIADGDSVLGCILLDEPGECPIVGASTMRMATVIGRLTSSAMSNLAEYRLQKVIATTLQDRLRPTGQSTVEGFDVAVRYMSATEGALVGGDFYDFFTLTDGRVVVVIGDVSGKGLQAAIDTAKAKYAVRALAISDPEPSRLMAALNDALVPQMPLGKFITMLYCVIDPDSGTVECASAGHPRPVVYSHASNPAASDESTPDPAFPYGLALGINQGIEYQTTSFNVGQGDYLVMFTDGLTEARPPGAKGMAAMIGIEGIASILEVTQPSGAVDIVEDLYSKVLTHSGNDLRDDLAILVIGRNDDR